MRRSVVAAAIAVPLTTLGAQVLRGTEPETVIFHDMAAMAKTAYGVFPDMRAVLTDSCSLAIATIPPHWKQGVHRHAHDQITLGRDGAVEFSIDGERHPLGSYAAGMSPANVEHGMVNDTDHNGVVIEYQPVLRHDWLPPHPAAPAPSLTAEPIHVSRDQQVAIDFDPSSPGWSEQNGARAKSITGQTIRATFWDVSKSGASVEIAAPQSTRERLVFVLDGRVSTAIGGVSREIGPEMLVEVRPSAGRFTLTSIGRGTALVVVFDTLPQ
jgi:quercetin dioxygenase-like cupin family protein